MNAPESRIAVTLFNLRDFCKTESDLDRTLARIREIGYESVQVSAVSLDAKIIRKALDRNGLYCCATHEDLNSISVETSAVLDKLDTLNCNFCALGMPTEKYRDSLEGVKNLCKIMNRAGEVFVTRGKVLGYHNHHFEFQRLPEIRETMFEYFYEHTDPKLVASELDVHWVTRGGGDPAIWIDRLASRLRNVIHFKDFAIINGGEPTFCEIGEGNLDWTSILAACAKAGTRFYSVEQDLPFGGRDIFESMEISYRNLRKMGLK